MPSDTPKPNSLPDIQQLSVLGTRRPHTQTIRLLFNDGAFTAVNVTIAVPASNSSTSSASAAALLSDPGTGILLTLGALSFNFSITASPGQVAALLAGILGRSSSDVGVDRYQDAGQVGWAFSPEIP